MQRTARERPADRTAGDGDLGTRRRGGRVIARALLAVLALCTAFPAMATTVREVAPGSLPTLKADEGLLLVEADSDVDLASLQLEQVGDDAPAQALQDVKAGSATRLLVVKAGRYAWHAVTPRGSRRYVFGDRTDAAFEVVPGRITYPGDLVMRLKGRAGVAFEMANRGLRAIDWLDAQHPQLAPRYTFVFAGHYPDPFPAFYAQERARMPTAVADLAAVDAPPSAGKLPLSIPDLWHYRRIEQVSLNPSGDLLVEAVHENDALWALDLVDLKTQQRTRLVAGPERYAALDWSGDHVLLAGAGNDAASERVTLFDITPTAGGAPLVDSERLPTEGHVLASNYGVADHVLFERRGAYGRLEVVALDIGVREGKRAFATELRGRLQAGADPDVGWYADGQGRVRAATLHRSDGTLALMYGEGTRFDEVLPLREGGFHPLGVTDRDDLVFGLSDEGRGQRDLVAFDPAQGKVVRTLFSKPGVDVVTAVVDDRRQPLGVTYYEQGRLVTTFLDPAQQPLADALSRAFPGKSVQIAARSRDGGRLMLWVEGSDQPATLYRYDVADAKAQEIDLASPWLKDKMFVAGEALQATSRDGLAVEAFLTLPRGHGKRALVVLPHGGPVGVSDRLQFTPEVQFLASLGYAVLQVNFRGSEGYGRAFRQAGYRAAGSGIEDDIDAAITAALDRYPLDADRMCIMGSSYGGYSALQSAVRSPGRFRCVVSIAGITDRALFFTASDSGNAPQTRAELERLVGDPNTELDAMVATSPLYQYRALTAPVMLVHGREDTRVDYEHANRLVRMLNLAGRRPVMLSFDHEGHNWSQLQDIATAYAGIAGFLRQHLDGKPGAG